MEDAIRKLNLWIRISKVDLSKFYHVSISRHGTIHLQGDFNRENHNYCTKFFPYPDYDFEFDSYYNFAKYKRKIRKYDFVEKITVTLD